MKSETTEDKRLVKRLLRLLALTGLTCGALAVCMWVVAVMFFCVGDFLGTRGLSEETLLASLPWIPSSAEVLFVENSHGGMHGEGRTFLAVRYNPEEFKNLIAGHEWKEQPIPQEITDLIRSSTMLFDLTADKSPPLEASRMLFYRESKTIFFLCDPEDRIVWYLRVTR